MALKENYKDDILDVSQNVKRKYQMENNGDGTVSFTDVTEYTQQGDSFGSGAINPIAHAINGLNNYNFHPSGSIDLVAYIADDSYYLSEDNKYVLADSTTGQALITSEPSTYKALASDTDLYGIEGEDTVSGFEPSCTPITVGGETLSTIDEKLNYLCGYYVPDYFTAISNWLTSTTTERTIVPLADISNARYLVIKYSWNETPNMTDDADSIQKADYNKIIKISNLNDYVSAMWITSSGQTEDIQVKIQNGNIITKANNTITKFKLFII